MRWLRAVKNDVRYQFRYGFYLIYALLTVLYSVALRLIPGVEVRGLVAGFVLLSDPAVLGYFFIGGIWMLEKEENLHGYFGITPQSCAEYVLAKVVSLGALSTLSAGFIAGFSGLCVNYARLLGAIFLSSALFTSLGLVLAVFAKSVNAYLLCATPPAIVLLAPAALALFPLHCPPLELLPGALSIRLILGALHPAKAAAPLPFLGLAAWCLLFVWLAVKAVRREIRPEGGEQNA